MAEALSNAAQRARSFREVLDLMVDGKSTREELAPWQSILDDGCPEDLVMVVDAAVADGIDFALLKPGVSRLINLMHASLVCHRYTAPTGEQFFSSLMAENRGLQKVLDQGKSATKALNNPDPATATSGLAGLSALVSALEAMEIHFRKKENVLFPWFEARYPQFRCVRLMWEIHDDARQGLRTLARLLEKVRAEATGGSRSSDTTGSADVIDPRLINTGPINTGPINTGPINALVGKLYFDLNTNLFREECALFPVMAAMMSGQEGQSLFAEAHEYGYAFLTDEEKAVFTVALGAMPVTPGFSGRTGTLPPEILGALFSTIHLDMTWVDADDKVRWFSDSPRRIFPRSPSIIGRDVRNCHPGASVGRVVSILEDFRAGRKDREAFWLTMNDRFIHIEYFALRSPDGNYLGTLEASEDLTEKRGLQGEKRLAKDERTPNPAGGQSITVPKESP